MNNVRVELSDPEKKMGYIYSRLVDFGQFMETRNYIGFLSQYGIEIDRNLINRGNFPRQTSLHSKRFF
ncbi:unnamed protein product [Meloidogyne enterolobii]|uniref:Uncharacterized protein n=1 Tax=Meloidogyne enterolobii TaxID=390850 RepID=A0ACB1A7S5_MELEN